MRGHMPRGGLGPVRRFLEHLLLCLVPIPRGPWQMCASLPSAGRQRGWPCGKGWPKLPARLVLTGAPLQGGAARTLSWLRLLPRDLGIVPLASPARR